MQIVIDISKEQYSLIMQSHRPGVERFISKEAMIYAIKNGELLPKGHGRLIDVSDLMPDSDYEDGIFYAVSVKKINDTPTIVKSDRMLQESE